MTVSNDEAVRMNIRELAERTGLSVRTIRYYLAQGLIPSPGARGKSATYGEEHILRLRLVQRLVDQYVPLTEIKARLARLSLDEVRALLQEAEQRQARLEQAAQDDSSGEYVSMLLREERPIWRSAEAFSLADEQELRLAPFSARQRRLMARPSGGVSGERWQRWQLAPGVELHVSDQAMATFHALVERLLQVAHTMEKPTE
jgi:Ca-activated chloride channel family protein